MRHSRTRSICPEEPDRFRSSCCCCSYAACNYLCCSYSWHCCICTPDECLAIALSQLSCLACRRNLQLNPSKPPGPSSLPLVGASKRPLHVATSVEEHLSISSVGVAETRDDCAGNPQDSDSIDKETAFATRKQTLRRLHAINELMQTERDYVNDLRHLVETCFNALVRQEWIPNEDKLTIFRNADEILQFHKLFLAALEGRASGESECQHIAKVLLDMGSQFQIYTTYCELHEDASSLCARYRERSEWSMFLKECIEAPLSLTSTDIAPQVSPNTPTNKRLHFEDYLIKPVQRICRYQLLIKEIAQHTPPDSLESYTLNEALQRMQKIVADIDNNKYQRDIQDRTNLFFQRLDGDWRLNIRHAPKLGMLVISGALEVTYMALGQSVAKLRYLGCFVFPTYLILVRPKKATLYEPKHWFPLRYAELEDLQDSEGRVENTFVIRCKKHAFSFSASCPQEKQLWIKNLEAAIHNARNDCEETVSVDNQNLEDVIVPSLPGIGVRQKRRSSQHPPSALRLSKSFTNILDIAITSGAATIATQTSSTKSLLRRSMSTTMPLQTDFVEAKDNYNLPCDPPSASATLPPSLGKRYSVDCHTHQKIMKKDKSDPESHASIRRRPSSMDLLTSANISASVIGKMSSQLKNNHQNAIRITVDHKLRDVCTQEYLASRAWWMRDKEITASGSLYSSKKRKSTSFMRTSVSSFSVMQTKRTNEVDRSTMFDVRIRDFEVQSTSSASSAAGSGKIGLCVDRKPQRGQGEQNLLRDTPAIQNHQPPAQPKYSDSTGISDEYAERDSALSLSYLPKNATEAKPDQSPPSVQSIVNHTETSNSIRLSAPKLNTGKFLVGRILRKLSHANKKPPRVQSQSNLHEPMPTGYHSDLPIENIMRSEGGYLTPHFAESNPSFSDLSNPITRSELGGGRSIRPKNSLLRWKNKNKTSEFTPTTAIPVDPDTTKNSEGMQSLAFAYASTPKQPRPKPSMANILKFKLTSGRSNSQ